MSDSENNRASGIRDIEVMELAAEICNDCIDENGRQRLESLLIDSPQARATYRSYMSLHADLFWQQEALVSDGMSSFEGSVDADRVSKETSPAVSNRWTATLLKVLAFAATVMLGIGLSYLFSLSGSSKAPKDTLAESTPSHEFGKNVATVTATLNCRWELNGIGQAIGYGSKLQAGQGLHLREGLAEVTFDSGVKVILQAPADWELVSDQVTRLERGRLTALVPDGAEGFRVNTQGLELIDRGTEFGVLADEAGNTELHVFEGLVEALYCGDELDEKMEWRTNDRVRFDPETRQVEKITRQSSSFVRHLSPTLGPEAGLLLDEDFDYPVGPLAGRNGGFGWAEAWENLSFEGNAAHQNSVGQSSLTFGLLNSSGNHACLKGSANRVRRRLGTTFGSIFDKANLVEDQDGQRLIGQDGKTIYLSFSMRVSDIDQGFYGVELHRGDGNRNRVLCVGHGAKQNFASSVDDATGFSVTSEINGKRRSFVEYGSVGAESNEVTFFVLKIVFGKKNQDRVFVYRDPPSLWDETVCEPVVTGKGNLAFDRLGLANFNGEKSFEVDHIRVATSFSAVTRPRWSSEPIVQTETQ